MNISVLSVFKEIFDPFLHTSLVHRAQEDGKVNIQVKEYFDFVQPKERIDAPTFGPGAGMLIKPEVVQRAIEMQEERFGSAYKVFLSPQGKKLDQKLLAQITQRSQDKGHLMVLSSRYEGMDARVEKKYADEIVSIGDFVVMGGDVPAMLLLEGMLRLIPGIVGKQESVEKESFKGPFLDHPEYTEPVDWQGAVVPDVVRSGNHAVIEQWRQDQAAKKTVLRRFDWVRSCHMSAQEIALSKSHIPPHYVALMHGDVLVKDGRVGTTSVTSLDIHDVARSCATYGINNYFIVTPLADQQKIVSTLLDFWQKGPGLTYNHTRAQAVERVHLVSNFKEVVSQIEKKHNKKPIVIATSARSVKGKELLSYFDHQKVWAHEQPVLLLIGTGQGLSEELVASCDYILMPVRGFTDYNHLSVRSATAIILDRWLGINEKP